MADGPQSQPRHDRASGVSTLVGVAYRRDGFRQRGVASAMVGDNRDGRASQEEGGPIVAQNRDAKLLGPMPEALQERSYGAAKCVDTIVGVELLST